MFVLNVAFKSVERNKWLIISAPDSADLELCEYLLELRDVYLRYLPV